MGPALSTVHDQELRCNVRFATVFSVSKKSFFQKKGSAPVCYMNIFLLMRQSRAGLMQRNLPAFWRCTFNVNAALHALLNVFCAGNLRRNPNTDSISRHWTIHQRLLLHQKGIFLQVWMICIWIFSDRKWSLLTLIECNITPNLCLIDQCHTDEKRPCSFVHLWCCFSFGAKEKLCEMDIPKDTPVFIFLCNLYIYI